ncbi:hypothetical protein ACFY5H_02120 [Streptomyces sp. NPDC013012]|uniref:hypothetical protein n=1 Tax=unclassified Streptomyces TaxID=2593676 RepID=UPI00368E51C9
MRHARRLTLVAALLVLLAQALLSAAYLFWFFPVFADGIGPDGPGAGTSGAGLTVPVSLAAGAVVTVLGLWVLYRLARALAGGPTATRPFLVAAVVQFLTLVGSAAIRLTPLAATAALSLLFVLAGLLMESRYGRTA